MFTTKGIDRKDKGKLSKFITCGGPQFLKINSMEIEKAKTGSLRVVFHMETPPVETEGFEGMDGHKGQIGNVRTFYMKNESQFNEFLTNIGIIADKLGVTEQVDSIKVGNAGEPNEEDFAEYLKQVSLFITGKFMWFIIKGEEYPKQDNSLGLSLQFRRYGFAASEAEGKGHLKPYDKNNPYDFAPYQKQSETAYSSNDL